MSSLDPGSGRAAPPRRTTTRGSRRSPTRRSSRASRAPGLAWSAPSGAGTGALQPGFAGVPDGWVPWPLLPAASWEAVDLVLKRALDLVLGTVLLALGLPVIAIAALLVKLTSPGPAFFLQTRKGLTEADFRLIKLRTMVDGAEAMLDDVEHQSNGSVFATVDEDPRVTPVGAWLRKLSIDELPQLVNVLKGEMSLVGPRPLVEEEVRRLPTKHRWARARMKPGLTCLWQVRGRNDCPDRQRLALDQRYLDEWSPGLDVRILLLTLPAVLFGRGAR